MIEITLLGRVSASVAGQPLTGEAAQRRRLALLALLCDNGLRSVGRDKLMAHLWPDNDMESARHLLSASLHVLRKALGADAIITSAEHVQLNAQHVRVDAIEFEQVARAGDVERAVELYTGVFAEGLFISGASEFEHWLDGRREELARLYAQALEGTAEARTRRGELDGAVAAWRKLATLDPYSARTTLGLMRALVAAGNRAGALQSARVHTRLLEEEFGATPEQEVSRLADELRQELPPAAPIPTARAVPEVHGDAPEEVGAATPVPSLQLAAATPTETAFSEQPVTPASRANVGDTRADTGRSRQRFKRQHVWVWSAAGAAVVLIAASFALKGALAGRDPALRVIAVVPLRAAPGELPDESYSDGIAESILNQLRSPQLRRIPSTSSFLFRDSTADARTIGRVLGADALVFVRVRMTEQQLRVSVELVRVRDGVLLWSKLPTALRGDYFSLINELALPIGNELRVQLTAAQIGGTTDDAAQELYWKARAKWRERTPGALRDALTLFQAAASRDSTYALAHVGIADAYSLLGSFEYGVLPPDSAYEAARAAAHRALRIVPDFAPALAARAAILMNYDRKWEDAERDFRRALELDSSYGETREWLAMLQLARGQREAAHGTLRAALTDNGISPLLFIDLAQYHYFQSSYDSAHHYIARALELNPTFSRAHALRVLVLCLGGQTADAVALAEQLNRYAADDPLVAGLLGYVYARDGRRDNALEQLEWLERLRKTRYVPIESLAMIHLGLDNFDRTIDLLVEASEIGSSSMIYLTLEPMLAPLRDQPRFQQLVRRVHGS